MTSFRAVAEAWIASREHCSGSLGRIKFWIDQFGDTIISVISDDDVDQALVNLERRGKLSFGFLPPVLVDHYIKVPYFASRNYSG